MLIKNYLRIIDLSYDIDDAISIKINGLHSAVNMGLEICNRLNIPTTLANKLTEVMSWFELGTVGVIMIGSNDNSSVYVLSTINGNFV